MHLFGNIDIKKNRKSAYNTLKYVYDYMLKIESWNLSEKNIIKIKCEFTHLALVNRDHS